MNWRLLGIPLIGEGVTVLLCLIPALHFDDGTVVGVLLSSVITLVAGVLFLTLFPRLSHGNGGSDKWGSYVTVALMWVLLALFGTLPFLLTGSCHSFVDAFFESMSGLTSTGATIIPDVEELPKSVLLWRSLSEWIGGYGIIMLVLAVVPTLGLNKYSLYTAEVSGADNTGKTASTMRTMVHRTLITYLSLTALFIVALFLSGMTLWESVNMTFTNISTGGFSIYADSIARFTPLQQYILAASMFVGGINFALLFNLFTIRWSKLSHKLDQFGFYVVLLVVSIVVVSLSLHFNNDYGWNDAVRLGVVQTTSVLTTTGSVIADTNLWWTPIMFLFLTLSFCGGMAGSTTGGLKVMRVLILFRNVRNTLRNRLHPHAYNPVRLNGMPVPDDIITNVMVIFLVFVATIMIGLLLLMVCGVGASESLGAVFGCLTTYGPGIGPSGGFGSYVLFPVMAKWLCTFLMLLGRLECLTVLILFLPGFWRRSW